MTIKTVNPATGKDIKTYAVMSDVDVAKVIDAGHFAYIAWRAVTIHDRAQCMIALADILEAKKEDIAALITTEMGKPMTAAVAEVEKSEKLCRYYAEKAGKFLDPHVIETEMEKSFVTYRPFGVIFAIMPWNFPLWQVMRFSVPNLMAGNMVLLKHASISTGMGLLIEKLFIEAGFPENVFRTVVIDVSQVEKIIAHQHVSGVTLTGSEAAGKNVASLCGQHLKKVVLELGGNDPYVILADADFAKAAKACVASRLNNAGQVCISAKRIIVVESVLPTFITLIMKEVNNYKMGDPKDPTVQLGPLARSEFREAVHAQVLATIKEGATLLQGGKLPDGPGAYYPITVLSGVKPGMTAFSDEIFGPVICLIAAKDEAHAIALANDSRFGLGAAVFTKDTSRGENIAVEQLRAGTVCVNRLVSSDQRLPFGGIKASGFGRELAEVGMHEFVNIKTICID